MKARAENVKAKIFVLSQEAWTTICITNLSAWIVMLNWRLGKLKRAEDFSQNEKTRKAIGYLTEDGSNGTLRRSRKSSQLIGVAPLLLTFRRQSSRQQLTAKKEPPTKDGRGFFSGTIK